MLCKPDQVYARELFGRAHQALFQAEAAPGGRASSSEPPGDLSGTRSFLFSRLAQCDAGLARRLSEQDELPGKREAHREARAYAQVRSALELVAEEPGRAAEFAAQAVQHGLTGTALQHWVVSLNRLRVQDRATADRVFLDALVYFQALPSVDANDLLALGLYLFTSPQLAQQNVLDGVSFSQVGRRVGVVNVSADRPDIAPDIARAYLQAVINILARPVLDPKQKEHYYVAGSQLLPKARQFIPERAPLLEGVLQALSYTVPPVLTKPESYATLEDAGDPEGREREQRISGLPGQEQRDEGYLRLVSSLVFRGQFARAREVAGKIRTPALQAKLTTLVDFAEAAQLLERNELKQAEWISRRLPRGIERCLLHLGIARARMKEDRRLASSSVFMALQDARSLEDDRRAYLILAAAGVMMALDPRSASRIFSQAVEAFNQQATSEKKQEAASSGSISPAVSAQPAPAKRREVPAGPHPFREIVETGNARQSFLLRVGNLLASDFESVVPPLAAADPEGTEGLVLSLISEDLLAQALPSLAAALLKEAESSRSGSEKPARLGPAQK